MRPEQVEGATKYPAFHHFRLWCHGFHLRPKHLRYTTAVASATLPQEHTFQRKRREHHTAKKSYCLHRTSFLQDLACCGVIRRISKVALFAPLEFQRWEPQHGIEW